MVRFVQASSNRSINASIRRLVDSTMLFIRYQLLGAARGPAQDDAAARAADEVDEVADLGGRQRCILLDPRHRARGIELGVNQITIRLLQLRDRLRREPAARESDRVHPKD